MRVPTLVTLASIAVSPAAAFFILNHGPLEATRIDPIINPGGISGHVHAIVGGSNFQSTMDFQTTQEAKCTTAPVSIDKSSYWTPQLYSYHDNAFTLIPNTGANTYYLERTDAPPQAFKEGHRMVSGNPNRRTFNESDPNHKAVSFVCLGDHPAGDPRYDQRNSFFEVPCQTWRMQVNFPTCSDGRLDSEDHRSHMTWPSGGVNGGVCPPSHPIAVIQLFYEFFYEVGKFPFVEGATNYVLSNGDTTGYGFHGDFISGWPTIDGVNVLQNAITDCNKDNGVGGVLTNCPPFVPYLKDRSGCIGQNDRVDEDIGLGHSLAALPGNNPIWMGEGTTKPTTANYKETAGMASPHSVLPAGWSRVGCVAEGTNGRALLGDKYTSTTEMTQATCAAYCASKGFKLAGVEYSEECYCDNEMRNGASQTLLDDDQCGLLCTGLATEECGGRRALSLLTTGAVPVKGSAGVPQPAPTAATTKAATSAGMGNTAVPKATDASTAVQPLLASTAATGMPAAAVTNALVANAGIAKPVKTCNRSSKNKKRRMSGAY